MPIALTYKARPSLWSCTWSIGSIKSDDNIELTTINFPGMKDWILASMVDAFARSWIDCCEQETAGMQEVDMHALSRWSNAHPIYHIIMAHVLEKCVTKRNNALANVNSRDRGPISQVNKSSIASPIPVGWKTRKYMVYNIPGHTQSIHEHPQDTWGHPLALNPFCSSSVRNCAFEVRDTLTNSARQCVF